MGPSSGTRISTVNGMESKEAIPLRFEAHLDAILRILLGLVKIYILAEWFQGRALRPNTDLVELSLLGLFVKVYAFYFFLYLNFSGYCDVVIGVGSLMGVKPPENFNYAVSSPKHL